MTSKCRSVGPVLSPWSVVSLLCAFSAALLATPPDTAGVAVLPPVTWSLGNTVRDGAGELEVLLRIAQLRTQHDTIGLISVGDRHGARLAGGERALRHAALTGVVVVKLAPGGDVAPAPDAVFLDGNNISAEQAGRILRACLIAHGRAPVVADAALPTRLELAAIRAHLAPFQAALDAARARELYATR